MLQLVIANKLYSSWSLRPWMVLHAFGIPFSEHVVALRQPDTKERIANVSPSGKVPVLMDDGIAVWESLAIIEQRGRELLHLVRTILDASRADAKALDAALRRLVELNHVTRVSAELYVDAAALADLEARLVAHLTAHGSIDAQGFKELSGQTRKYAIPYAEHFDAKKVTLRVGDVRKLRGR